MTLFKNNVKVYAWITSEEADNLSKQAADLGLSRSAYIHLILTNIKPTVILTHK